MHSNNYEHLVNQIQQIVAPYGISDTISCHYVFGVFGLLPYLGFNRCKPPQIFEINRRGSELDIVVHLTDIADFDQYKSVIVNSPSISNPMIRRTAPHSHFYLFYDDTSLPINNSSPVWNSRVSMEGLGVWIQFSIPLATAQAAIDARVCRPNTLLPVNFKGCLERVFQFSDFASLFRDNYLRPVYEGNPNRVVRTYCPFFSCSGMAQLLSFPDRTVQKGYLLTPSDLPALSIAFLCGVNIEDVHDVRVKDTIDTYPIISFNFQTDTPITRIKQAIQNTVIDSIPHPDVVNMIVNDYVYAGFKIETMNEQTGHYRVSIDVVNILMMLKEADYPCVRLAVLYKSIRDHNALALSHSIRLDRMFGSFFCIGADVDGNGIEHPEIRQHWTFLTSPIPFFSKQLEKRRVKIFKCLYFQDRSYCSNENIEDVIDAYESAILPISSVTFAWMMGGLLLIVGAIIALIILLARTGFYHLPLKTWTPSFMTSPSNLIWLIALSSSCLLGLMIFLTLDYRVDKKSSPFNEENLRQSASSFPWSDTHTNRAIIKAFDRPEMPETEVIPTVVRSHHLSNGRFPLDLSSDSSDSEDSKEEYKPINVEPLTCYRLKQSIGIFA